MARRHAPVRRWRVGDRCQVPWYRGASAGVHPSWAPGSIGGWHDGEVVAVRGDRVIVRRYGWESDHPWWEPRQPPRHRPHWHPGDHPRRGR